MGLWRHQDQQRLGTTSRLLMAQPCTIRAVVLRATVRALGVEAEKVLVIPNGRDVSKYGAGDRHSSGDEIRLAFVGHLVASKRPDVTATRWPLCRSFHRQIRTLAKKGVLNP